MKVTPNKSSTRARGRDALNYCLRSQNTPETNFCKYLGIFVRSDFSWAAQVDYSLKRMCSERGLGKYFSEVNWTIEI
jgi:hypothetical protein